MAKRTRLEDSLLEILADPDAIAAQSDLAQAAALERQSLSFRQRAGAAALRLRSARMDGADVEEIAELEGRLEKRVARLDSALVQASAANVKRPTPQNGTAQIFARATGPVEKPPLTLAAIDKSGKVIATQASNASGVAAMTVKGDLNDVTLQFSDCDERVLYRSPEPVSVPTGTVYYLDAEIGAPKPEPCPVPMSVKMPDLIGQSGEAAKALMQRLGNENLDFKTTITEGPPGIVLKQNPLPGTTLDADTNITLTLSKESAGTPDQLYMPGLIGELADVAQGRLKKLGLKANLTLRQSEARPNEVLSQSPKEGSVVKPGTVVDLIVSQADDTVPTTVVVPDLIAKSREIALEILKSMNLNVDLSESDDPKKDAGVIEQDPAAGTTVALKSVVKLLVNTPEKPEASNVLLPNLSKRPLPDARAILKKLGLEADVKRQINAAQKDLVIAHTPPAGMRVAPKSTVTLVVSSGSIDTSDKARDLTQLSRSMALDDRAANVAGDAERIEKMLRANAVDTVDAARALAALEPRALRERMGIGKLKSATTFRAILRKSLRDMD